MGIRKFVRMGSLILVVTMCSLVFLTGCIVITTDSEGDEIRRTVSKIWPRRKASGDAAEEALSFKGSATEFGRGVTNVAFCWLEIPYELESGIREASEPGIGGIIHTAWEIVEGSVKGAIGTVGRAGGGVLEIAFSPFPPYGPLMRPSLPPYLNFPEKTPEKKEAPAEPASATETASDKK